MAVTRNIFSVKRNMPTQTGADRLRFRTGEYIAPKSSNCPDALILVRAAPGSGAGQAAIDTVRSRDTETGPMVVFLHGAGVDWALPQSAAAWADLARDNDLSLLVCQAAWQRRHGEAEPSVFAISSLVQFWRQAVHARDLVVFG